MKKSIHTMTTLGRVFAVALAFVTPLHAENEKLGEESIVRVMTYNACRGGTYLGQALSQSAKMIQLAKADIVGLQEIGENVPKLANLLAWNHWGPFLSRYEIVDHAQGMGKRPWYGIKVKLPSGQHAYAFNAHLPNPPNQAYQLLGLKGGYRTYPKIDTEEEAIAGAKKARGKYISRLLKLIKSFALTDDPIFVVGDFNEPSHLDWTEAAAKAGHHPMKVSFPTSLMMAEAGFTDSYRTIHPDEVAKPGLTWSPVYEPAHPDHHLMRIDYVYFKGKGVKVTGSKIIGEDKEHADIVVAPYPSDHRAVVATFTLAKQADSMKLNTSK
ncbi:endonuclease/exonuclease/phosphatase family protein [Lentisphaera profundi]|uniref:Endonuclease/exonuclease/phosphatase family protein n=1 Tax=Lentisphaera profundi TaxID=1658616 RepID=A0ABY7W3R8_9BACT|nr:endonuclease/exonuclease/phosphatase family protein [Lentisphaera profundi]WDE98908.1 endonuclease/exonuclease/phosphatase family protein [Lentisphaera profundi]